MSKGLVAGATNLVLAVILSATLPGALPVLGASLVGFLSYGASLTLFVVALRHLGTAQTCAYFSVAPFFGGVMALTLLHETVTGKLLLGGTLMAIGVVLHLTERHVHEHTHEPLEHTHFHTHDVSDEHHMHKHDESVSAGTHHRHRHLPITHTHPHYPGAHHQHLY